MSRTTRRFRLDPLARLLLAASGIAPAVSCGGSSVGEADDSGGTGGSATGGIGARPDIGICETPSPVGTTGWVGCGSGAFHRETVGSCPSTLPEDPAICGDCSALPYGHCFSSVPFSSMCIPGCLTDDDCSTGEICFCESPVGRCITAACSTDANCGAGSLCATYKGPPEPACSYSVTGVACQVREDRCVGNECNCVMGAEHRECQEGIGGCGRPFLVDGAERLAAPERRSDWMATARVPNRLAELPAAARAALAEHWTRVGLMEHASIAAFARFSLELLALGAPAELVRDATSAMADETRHAELCFGLASAYAGRPVGPGVLGVSGCLDHPTLASVVRTVLLEGCVGETVAAAEARELAALAEDPMVRDTLSAIAEDEARHAALAYRFVRWALDQDRSLVAAVVREAVAGELRKGSRGPRSSATDEAPARTLALGMPTSAFRAELEREVREHVVAPCLAALLEDAEASARAA